jgi:excisionase family DNA binding protein
MNEITFETLPLAVGQLFEKLASIDQVLQKVLQHQEQQAPQNEFIPLAEAAEFIKLKKSTIYGLVHRSEIPHSKKGKLLYFSRKELTQWIASGRKRTIKEIAASV